MAVAVGPGPELLQDPGRLAGRRIGQAVAKCLRPRRLLLRVAGVPVGVILDALERARFLGRRLADHVGPRRHSERDVDAGAVRGIERADRRRHRRAPVAALSAVTSIAQAIHQPGPGAGNAIDAPAGRRRFA